MNDIMAQLEAVGRRYRELDEKTAEKGGLGNLIGIYTRLAEVLDLVPGNDLDFLLHEIQRAKDGLNQLEHVIREINALREVFASVKERLIPIGGKG